MSFFQKLTAVMFYASLPLLIPFFYSLYNGDGGWVPIGMTIFILASPAVPGVIMSIFENIANLIKHLLQPDAQFNYGSILNMAEMRKHVEMLTFGEIMALTSFAWLLIPTIATIPYIYYGVEPVDAFFESVSSWTSTGLTALKSVEVLPKSIILFRSVTQWIGGLGIVVLMLTIVKGKEAISFLKAEGLSPSEVGIGKTVGMILKIYITLSILGIAALYALDIGLFDAVNLSLSGVSNGGSFPFDHYEFSNIQKIVLAMLMFAGATSFLFYRNISRGEFRKALLDEEYLLYVSIIIAAIALIYFIGGEEFFNTVLNTISSIACGGYAIGDLSVMHAFPIYILILLMLSGGMLGSTTGGIKLWRILVIIKAILKHVK
ncbi:TPA: hypothetical protein EYP38_00925, partial [Candidatus Micrarchaeota archaeon]|nr:hypothetical protein [Candidatus Micrarchaeota archaeon]